MSEKYQALYRVWRPRTFSEMVGQEAVRRTLRNQVRTGRIAHAYLFCGSRGTGKTSAAKIMARAINCLSPRDGDPCGECESCRAILGDQSLDVYEMDAASNSRVEEIRELLEKVDYPPQFGKYKVYIIDEVHMLSNSAFNALLKTLEEPPEYMVFILATTEPQKLLPTILSRCQRFDFGRIPEKDIVSRLRLAADKAGVEAEESALYAIAEAAEGGMRDAFSIMDMCMGAGEKITESSVHMALGSADREVLLALCGAIADRDSAACLRIADQVMREGWDVQVFLKDLTAMMRRMMTILLCGTDEEEETAGGERYRRMKELADRFTVPWLMRVLQILLKAEGDTRWAASQRSVLEIAVLSACQKQDGEDLSALLERIAYLEKQLERMKTEGVVLQPKPGQPKPADAKEVPAPSPRPRPTENEVWKKAMRLMQGKDPSSYGLMVNMTYGGCVEHEYRLLVLPGGSEMAILKSRKALDEMEECLREAGDPDARFEILVEGSRENAEWNKMVDRNEKMLAELVGREKLIVT